LRLLNKYNVAVAVALAFAPLAHAGEALVVDRVAAVIESDIITLRELEKKAQPYLLQLDEIEDAEEKQARRLEILKRVLDIEIGEKIVAKELEGAKERLGVTSQDVDRAIEEVLQSNNLSREQLQAALYGQGMTWSEYRQKLREQIERARLIQFRVQGRIQIKPADVRRRCMERAGALEKKVCASHILLKIPDGASAKAIEGLRARVSQMQAELANGGDFAAYALKHSDDKGAPDGDLGCFGRGEMVEAFEKVAFKTPVGKISPVVRTEFGFHIIRVNELRSPSKGVCESHEDLVPFQNEIYQEEMARQMDMWIEELRKKAFVDVRL